MRIFMTGATGYIGNAVALALRERGHEVAALVRPDSEAHGLRDRGVFILSGDLESLPDLRDTIVNYDAVVHTAASKREQVGRDKIAVDTFTSVNAFVVYTSGVWVLGNTGNKTVDEDSKVDPLALVAWRPVHEKQVLATGRAAVIRPGCVYGGKQSLLASWFVAAGQNRPLQIAGEGDNRWAMVDLHDAADCYARVVEQRATGVFHAVDDTRATLNECAKAIAPRGAVEHLSLDTARRIYGPFADALAVDQQVSSAKTRETLGWSPRRTFVESVDAQWQEWREAQTT